VRSFVSFLAASNLPQSEGLDGAYTQASYYVGKSCAASNQ